MTAGSHILIQNAAGALISATEGRLATATVGDDSCLWRREDNHLVHVDGVPRLTLEPLDAHEYSSPSRTAARSKGLRSCCLMDPARLRPGT